MYHRLISFLSNGYLLQSLSALVIMSSLLLSFIPGGNVFTVGISASLAGLAIIYLIIGRKEFWIGSELIVLVLWLIYAMLPSLFAIDTDKALDKFLTMGQLTVLIVVMLQVCIWQRSTHLIIWAFILSVVTSYLISFTDLYGIIIQAQGEAGAAVSEQTAAVSGQTVSRISGTMGNANTFGVAVVLAQALIILLLSMKSTTAIERIIGIACLLLLIAAVVNSGSRTALIGMSLLILGMPLVFNVWHIKNLIKMTKWGLVISLLIAGFWYGLGDIPEVQDRYYTVIEESQLEVRINDLIQLVENVFVDDQGNAKSTKGTLEARVDLAYFAWEVATEYPLGVGLDNFRVLAGAYAHSNYLELLADTGLIGVLLYYTVFLLIIVKLIKMWFKLSNNALPKALILGVLVLALMDLAHVTYYRKTAWLFLIIVIATTEILKRQMIQANHRRRKRYSK